MQFYMSLEDLSQRLNQEIKDRNQKMQTALRILKLPKTDPVFKDPDMQKARLQAARLVVKEKRNGRCLVS